MPLTALCAIFLVSNAGSFEEAVAKITGAEGLSASFFDHTMTGEKTQWTLKLQRPNKLRAESASQTVVADGTKITFLDKSDDKYSEVPETDFAFAKLLARPEFFLARLLFQSSAPWVSKTASIPGRSRDGVALTGSQISPDDFETASIYVTPDDSISLVQVDTGIAGSRITHMLDKVQVVFGHVADPTFQLVLPSDAVPIGATQAPEISEGAKRDAANGYLPYKQLSWDDFPLSSSGASPYLANTVGFIHYDFKCSYRSNGNGFDAVITKIEVRSGLDSSQTWKRSPLTFDPDKLLRHEQGHLDINEAHARKLRKSVQEQLPRGKGDSGPAAEADLVAKVKSMVESILADSNAEQKQYDDETDHGKIEQAQMSWLAKIKKELDDSGR